MIVLSPKNKEKLTNELLSIDRRFASNLQIHRICDYLFTEKEALEYISFCWWCEYRRIEYSQAQLMDCIELGNSLLIPPYSTVNFPFRQVRYYAKYVPVILFYQLTINNDNRIRMLRSNSLGIFDYEQRTLNDFDDFIKLEGSWENPSNAIDLENVLITIISDMEKNLQDCSGITSPERHIGYDDIQEKAELFLKTQKK